MDAIEKHFQEMQSAFVRCKGIKSPTAREMSIYVYIYMCFYIVRLKEVLVSLFEKFKISLRRVPFKARATLTFCYFHAAKVR